MNKTADAQRREKIRDEIGGLKLGIKARQEAMKNDQFVYEQKKVVKPIDINSALGRRKVQGAYIASNRSLRRDCNSVGWIF